MTPKPDDRSTIVDPRVADAWAEASTEEPSASVDAAILAAARREVSARPEALNAWKAREARASRRRWWPLAAAATVAAVAVGVLQLTPTDKLVSPATETATVTDVPPSAAKPDAGVAASTAPPAMTPAPAAASEPSPPPPAAQAKEKKAARSDDARARGEAQKALPQRRTDPVSAAPAPPVTSAAAPAPFPAAKKAAADTAAAGGQVAASPPLPSPAQPRAEVAAEVAPNVARESEPVARSAPPPPPAAAPAPAPPLAKFAAGAATDSRVADARAKDRKPLPVPDWIALIRRLRAEGKVDEAAKELAAFRTAHPDHEKLLPPDLRDWRPAEK